MKQIEVSREFLEEFEELKKEYVTLFGAMEDIYNNRDDYTLINTKLFGGPKKARNFMVQLRNINANELVLMFIKKAT